MNSESLIDTFLLKLKICLGGIYNINYVMIDSAGHNAWIDHPKQFITELKKALKNKKE